LSILDFTRINNFTTINNIIIRKFISIFFITGELNEETAKLMATPRCGVKDKVGPAADGRSKRYALQGKIIK